MAKPSDVASQSHPAARGVYLLDLRHAPAMQRMLSDREVTQWTRIPCPYPENGAVEFVREQTEKRARGEAYSFAIEQRGILTGVVTLMNVQNSSAELGYWIGRAFWGQGLATYAATQILEFAFQNLRLSLIRADAVEQHIVSRRVLEKTGFRFRGTMPNDVALATHCPNLPLARYELTRVQWLEYQHADAVAALHPGLRILLEAELAAGNEIRESRRGWPEPNSVFIRLREPLRVTPRAIPEGVHYSCPNDSH